MTEDTWQLHIGCVVPKVFDAVFQRVCRLDRRQLKEKRQWEVSHALVSAMSKQMLLLRNLVSDRSAGKIVIEPKVVPTVMPVRRICRTSASHRYEITDPSDRELASLAELEVPWRCFIVIPFERDVYDCLPGDLKGAYKAGKYAWVPCTEQEESARAERNEIRCGLRHECKHWLDDLLDAAGMEMPSADDSASSDEWEYFGDRITPSVLKKLREAEPPE